MDRYRRGGETGGIVRQVVLKAIGIVRTVATGGFCPRGTTVEGNRTGKYYSPRSNASGTKADCASNGGGSVHGERPRYVQCAAAVDCQRGGSIAAVRASCNQSTTVDHQSSESIAACTGHGTINR